MGISVINPLSKGNRTMKNTFFTKALLTALLTVPATQTHATIVEINAYKRNTFVESLIVGVATAVIYGLASEACRSDDITYTYTSYEPSYMQRSSTRSTYQQCDNKEISNLNNAQNTIYDLQNFIRVNTQAKSIEKSATSYTQNTYNNAFTPGNHYPFLNFTFGIERQIEKAQTLLKTLQSINPHTTSRYPLIHSLINQTTEIVTTLKDMHRQVTFHYRYHQELKAHSYDLDRMIPQYYR